MNDDPDKPRVRMFATEEELALARRQRIGAEQAAIGFLVTAARQARKIEGMRMQYRRLVVDIRRALDRGCTPPDWCDAATLADVLHDESCHACGKAIELQDGRPEPTCDCATQGGDR